MLRKTIGYILVVVGVIILIVSLGADQFGLGAQASFGFKQIAGTVVGVVVALVGIWLALSKPKVAQ